MDRTYYRTCSAEELVEYGLQRQDKEGDDADLIVALAERLDSKTKRLDDYLGRDMAGEYINWNGEETLKLVRTIKDKVLTVEEWLECLRDPKPLPQGEKDDEA